MDLGLAGKRAAVAAATTGLGFATARALVAEGVLVTICGRDEARSRAAAAKLGPDVEWLTCDLTNPDEAGEFVETARTRMGGLDILVTNGPGPAPGDATSRGADEYRAAFESVALSSIAMCLAVAPQLQQQRWGRILGVTSVSVRSHLPSMALSTASRAGFTGFLSSLAIELAPDGVTVNSLQPGKHATARARSVYGADDALAASDVPMGSLGSPDDFGAIAAFLCSERAGYITGAAIPVDGGMSGRPL